MISQLSPFIKTQKNYYYICLSTAQIQKVCEIDFLRKFQIYIFADFMLVDITRTFQLSYVYLVTICFVYL